MKLNLLNTAIIAAAIILICSSMIKEVQSRSLMTNRNQQPGIYSDRSWTNNDETETFPRNTWILDLNDNLNRKEDINDDADCGKDSACADRQGVMRVPIKKDLPSSSGWGAGGMPFNILYMKNPKPVKSPRSQYLPPAPPASYGIIAEPLRSQPNTGSGPQAQRQYQSLDSQEDENTKTNEPKTMSLLNGAGAVPIRNVRPKGRSSNGSFLIPSRRHYSIIPQLFVSYGWGPTV